MKRRVVSAGVAIAVIAAGCASGGQGNSSSTVSTTTAVTSSLTTAPTTTVPASSTTSSTTTTTTTTGPTTSTSLLPLSTCDGMVSIGATSPADYGEAALDRFGPLTGAPSMTIRFGHDLVSDPVGVRASRIEGGVLVSASRSPNSPSTAGDQVPFVAVNHDGTIRWSHCVEASREIWTAVAAPQLRPANAVIQILTANVPQNRYRFVELSLTTGAEQSTFATAMQSMGVDADALTHLGIADVTERYALLADNLDTGGAIHRLVRFDMVAETAADIEVPAELSQAPTSGLCRFGSNPELSGTGDVIAVDLTTDVVSGAVDHLGTGAVLARWHDGTWTRDPSALVSTFGVRPGFDCDDNVAKAVLHGVDAIGQVQWTNPDLTHPGADDIGWYLDGDVAVGTVCSRRQAGDCTRDELVGLDPATGTVRWTQPGFRLVAGDPADGYALVWAEPTGDVLEPPGWVMIDDRTGDPVPGQQWDDPELFTLHPSREVAGFNRTVRAGGVVLVVKDDQVQVWYPNGTGGDPRTVLLP